jgi:hypothetical protein
MTRRQTKKRLTIFLPTRLVAIFDGLRLITVNFFGIFYDLAMGINKFLGPVANGIYGRLSIQELFRVLTLASSTGATAQVICQSLSANIDTIVVDKTTAQFIHALIGGAQHNYFVLWVAIAVFCLDCMRRMRHGPQQPPTEIPQ